MNTEVVVSADDSKSFAVMREVEKKAAQDRVKETLPARQIKKVVDTKEYVVGRSGPALTRGQLAKQEAAARRAHRTMAPVPVEAGPPVVTPIVLKKKTTTKPATKPAKVQLKPTIQGLDTVPPVAKVAVKKTSVKKTPATKKTAKKTRKKS